MGCSLRLWLDNEGFSVLLHLDFRLSYHINAVKFVIEKNLIFPFQFTFFLLLRLKTTQNLNKFIH